MPRVNKSKYAILGVLSFKPMSAYGVKMFMQRTTQHFWSESEAQIYPAIKKLYEENLLSAHDEQAEKVGTKRIYTLTAAGKEVLQTWLKEKTTSAPYRNEHLLKIFFGANQSHQENISFLQHWISETDLALAILKTSKQELKGKEIPKHRKIYPMLTIDYGLQLLEAEKQWCLEAIKTLQANI